MNKILLLFCSIISFIFYNYLYSISLIKKNLIVASILLVSIYALYKYFKYLELKNRNKLIIEKYSNKSFAVFSRSSKYNKHFSKLNGKWDYKLSKNRKGWIFPRWMCVIPPIRNLFWRTPERSRILPASRERNI